MPTLRILYDVAGWAFYNNAVALRKYAPSDFEVSLAAYLRTSDLDAALGDEAPDILVLCRFSDARFFREELDRRGWPTKLVSIWNNGWPSRVEYLGEVLTHSDLVVFANRQVWDNAGRPANGVMIPMGVDLDIFNIRVPVEERSPKVLWCGSELFRELKGYDAYAAPLAARLEKLGIACDFRLVDSFSEDNLSPEEMAGWYNSGTVFLCTSLTEGTPNVALEAAACGCALVSTRVGNMPELIENQVNGLLVEREISELQRAVEMAVLRHRSLAAEMRNRIGAWSWRERGGSFFEAARALLDAAAAPVAVDAAAVPDLSDEVTVFVLTVGAPSYEACLGFLERQDCRFRLEIVDHVAPISAAYQCMIDRCQTPYYVMVDEDMLLYSHAVRTLYKKISTQPANVAFYCAWLHDTHLDRNVQGVKIFRHAILRGYPARDVIGCDVDQNQRMKADGYPYVIARRGSGGNPFAETLGLHGTVWTDETIYLRYFILEARRRKEYKRGGWSGDLLVELGRKLRQDPSRENFIALAGAMIGWMKPGLLHSGEKDFKTYGDTPGLKPLLDLLDGLDEGAAARDQAEDGTEIEPSPVHRRTG